MVISAWTCIDLGFILKVCKNLALQSIPLIQCNVFQPCCAIQCQAKRQGKRQNRLASAVSVLNIWNMSHVWVDRVKQHMRSNPWHQTRPPRSCTSNRQRRRLRLSHAESTVCSAFPHWISKFPLPVPLRQSAQMQDYKLIVFGLFQHISTRRLDSTRLTPRVHGLHGGFFNLRTLIVGRANPGLWKVENLVNGLSQGGLYLWDSLRLRDAMRYLHNLPLHPQDLEGVPF